MRGLVKKVAVGTATAALLAQSLIVPAFGAINVQVTGNGSDSDNTVEVAKENATVVQQTNTANISNQVDAKANTGDNEASDNTGGDVNIDTGNAQTAVSVENDVNSNQAHVACGGCPTDVNVVVSGNGSDSDNDVTLGLSNETFVTQNNAANLENDIDAESNSGKNDADDNTGGNVSIDTGRATTVAEVSNRANANVAHVAGGEGTGALNLWITGNGSESANDIDVDLDNALVLDQTNWANIENDVDVDAFTGYNDANDNTGGSVSIDTGSAFAGAAVDNEANFNWAAVEDCCELDGTIKVAGNGSDSENDVKFENSSFLGAYQDNSLECGGGWWESFWWGGKDNCSDVDAKAKTGGNDINDSTGSVYGDPSIDTGNASTEVEVGTKGNSNIFHTGDALSQLPDWEVGGENWNWAWGWMTGSFSN